MLENSWQVFLEIMVWALRTSVSMKRKTWAAEIRWCDYFTSVQKNTILGVFTPKILFSGMVCGPQKYVFSERSDPHLFKTSTRSKIPSLHFENGRVKNIFKTVCFRIAKIRKTFFHWKFSWRDRLFFSPLWQIYEPPYSGGSSVVLK